MNATNRTGIELSAMSKGLFSVVMIVAGSSALFAQAQAGGAAAGIGRTYEAAGRSEAARGLQRKLKTALVRAVANEKAKPRSSTSSKSKTSTPRVSQDNVNAATYFKPEPGADTMAAIANDIGSNAIERQQLLQLFSATKTAFGDEVAAKGRSNNLAAAFTFFIASTVTVYRDDPEPSDEAIEALWDGMNSALVEMPEVARLTNGEKQQLYDLLVAFSGFVLAGYLESKSTGDVETQKVFKALSAELIRTILHMEPDKLRFNKAGLDIVN